MKDTNSQDSLELKLVHSTFDWSFRAFCISLVSKLTLVENCSIVKGFPQGSYFKASYFENSRTNGKIGYKICSSRNLQYGVVLFKLPFLYHHIQHKWCFVSTLTYVYSFHESLVCFWKVTTKETVVNHILILRSRISLQPFFLITVSYLFINSPVILFVWLEYGTNTLRDKRGCGADHQLPKVVPV